MLDGGGGRGEKGKEALSLFRFHLPLFSQKCLILRIFVWFVCLFPRGRRHPNVGVVVTEMA